MRHTQSASWALLCALVTTSCIIDDPCDDHQLKVEGFAAACACEPGYVVGPEGYGCVKCGKNEEAKGNECVCKDGFSRASPTADCEPFEAGDLGSECQSDAECSEEAPFCAVSETPGYCTAQGCERASDCAEGWRCNSAGAPSFCEKAPSGLGMSCESSADCAGSDAAYCEAFMSHSCMIDDCLKQPNKCVHGTVCCDLTGLIGVSLCAPTNTLVGGKCYGGAEPVTP